MAAKGDTMTRLAPAALLALLLVPGVGPKAQEAQAEADATAQSGPAYFVQLASLNSSVAAEQAWDSLKEAHPSLLGDMPLSLQTIDLGDRGVFYRVQTGPLPNRATAKDLCWQIKAEKQDCVVIRR